MFDQIKTETDNSIRITPNVRNSVQKISSQPRKTRCDKKTDVKIPLTLEQRKEIRRRSIKAETVPTYYCSLLVKKGIERSISFPSPDTEYPSASALSFHIKLEKPFIEKLDQWCVEWDCSRKRAAYRILIGMIESGWGL
jgi:hypothetical protein